LAAASAPFLQEMKYALPLLLGIMARVICFPPGNAFSAVGSDLLQPEANNKRRGDAKQRSERINIIMNLRLLSWMVRIGVGASSRNSFRQGFAREDGEQQSAGKNAGELAWLIRQSEANLEHCQDKTHQATFRGRCRCRRRSRRRPERPR